MVYAVIVGGGVNNECGDEKGWFRALRCWWCFSFAPKLQAGELLLDFVG